ncbi:MAG: 3-coathanger stack domain-containing protein [Bacteroidota bacterium]
MKKIFLFLFATLFGVGSILAQSSECEEDLEVNNETEVVNNRVQASNKVTISRKLYDGEQLEVRGGQVIELLPGFETEYGVSVDAANGDCEDGEELCPIICQFIGMRDPSEDMCCFEWQDNPNLKRPMRRVCPDATTTYILKIIRTNGTIETQNFTVEVEGVEFTQNPYYLREGQNSVELALTESYASYEWAAIGGDGTPMTATSPTFTVSFAGTYGVTVTDDNGCELKGEVAVENAENPLVEVLTPDPSICVPTPEANLNLQKSADCAIGTLTLEVSGGSSYQWEDNTTNSTLDVTTSGEYNVTVTNEEGCSTVEVIEVEDCDPDVEIMPSSAFICPGTANSFVDLMTGDEFSNHIWRDKQGNVVGTSSVYRAISPNTYTVTATNASGCTSNASAIVYSVILDNIRINSVSPNCINGPISDCMEGQQLRIFITGSDDLKYEYVYSINGVEYDRTMSDSEETFGLSGNFVERENYVIFSLHKTPSSGK